MAATYRKIHLFGFDGGEIGVGGEVGFRQQEQLGVTELEANGVGDPAVIELASEGGGVGQDHEGFERETWLDQGQLGDAPGVADAAGFDDDVFGRRGAGGELGQGLAEILAHRAAHAAIGQGDAVAVRVRDQGGVDIDRAEIIDQ